jgi:septal ring factor EnvC (AmiA/AmiB activator)
MAVAAILTAVGGYLLNRSQSKRNTTDATSAAVTAATSLVEAQQKRIDQLHRDMVDSECKLRQTRTELAETTARLSTVERELAQTRTELAQTRAENELLRERIVELEAERQMWEEERKKLQAQITRLTKEVRTRGLSETGQ